MNKLVYFGSDNPQESCCQGQKYYDFLDYAFSKADYFMLVYINYYGKGYSAKQKYFKEKLAKFKVKSRSNPIWPGTPSVYIENTTYKIVFYKTVEEAKEYLKEVESITDWSMPEMPEDLAFFKRNHCWFHSVGHEDIAGMVNPDEEDLNFLESKGLASRKEIVLCEENSYGICDEKLL